MPFDRENNAHRQALDDEYKNDPLPIGYAVAGGGTDMLLDLINDPTKNEGGETTQTELTVGVLLSLIDIDDLDTNNPTRTAALKYIDTFLQRDFDTDLEPWRDRIRAAFGLQSQTTANIDGNSRRMSRAEVLFGKGAKISKHDLYSTRGNR